MSTDETQGSESPSESAHTGLGVKLVVGLLIALLIVFLGAEAVSLLAAQRTEDQRRQVGMAGGECEFENRSSRWLKAVAGDAFHSFMDYPVIVGVTLTGSKIGDVNLSKLPEMPDLRSLDLHDSHVTSDGLKLLTQWESLGRLNLGNTQVTDISSLAKLPHLEILQLNFSQVRREYLAELPQLKRLKTLGAGYLQVTDPDVVEIAKCSQLKELSIAASDLGEHGLQPLTDLQDLEKLVLIDAKYDSADVQAFQSERPEVTVVR